ncbi:L,D-transpeptidase catalytic domain-containing protein [Sphingomonas antarctica]|uniref:L,D-transpeptidase n=1 Tax=Sphingomonas antarctica TaxID=2040274 RepID=UPI0039EA5454
MFKLSLLALALVLVAAGVPPQVDPPAIADGVIEQLKPGQYLWAPDIAPEGPVTVIVSVATQRAYAYRNGVPIGVSTVSTGKKGHLTPTGIFTILQKAVEHKSNLYSDAPMPFMQRLTWDGIALHAGPLPGYPASHGCIRLPLAFAKLLYAATTTGVTVVVTQNATVPEIAPTPTLLSANPKGSSTPNAAYWWQPQLSPTGPVSIVVSGRDRRIVVLRNGILIGASDLGIDGAVIETAAFTLSSIGPHGYNWLRLTLPGPHGIASQSMTADERARARVPEQFRLLLDGILTPGATLLVTRDTLNSSGTGKRLTIISTDNRPSRTR